jgi:hypothetical protein
MSAIDIAPTAKETRIPNSLKLEKPGGSHNRENMAELA